MDATPIKLKKVCRGWYEASITLYGIKWNLEISYMDDYRSFAYRIESESGKRYVYEDGFYGQRKKDIVKYGWENLINLTSFDIPNRDSVSPI